MHFKNVSGVALCAYKILQELLYLCHEGRLEIHIQELILNIYAHKRFEYTRRCQMSFTRAFELLLSAVVN